MALIVQKYGGTSVGSVERIQNVARREGVEKVVLLVEKDEVSSWTRVGFVREGTIPGFYKRSDGQYGLIEPTLTEPE